MDKLRLAIFISGRGSNMTSLLEASTKPDYPALPSLVVSNNPEAGGLDIARVMGVPTFVESHKSYKGDREMFERVIHAQLLAYNIDIIALAGFMRILSPWFVKAWHGRLVNIHPSLLPKYKGLNTHQRALHAGDTHGGCSVHWVTEGVDEGDIIAQASVPIMKHDTPDKLAERVIAVEHSLYPRALVYACQILSESN